jgi:hypothetical protein
MKYILLIIYSGSIWYAGGICLYADTLHNFHARHTSFIKSLFLEKHYFAVIAETERLQQYEPRCAHDPDYTYFIETNYFLGKQYLTIIDRYPLIQAHVTTHFPLKLLIAESYYITGYPAISLELLSQMESTSLPARYRHELLLRTVEIYLASNDFKAAYRYLSSYHTLNNSDPAFDALYNDLALYTDISYKSPALAMGLSAIIPGSGQLYCGRYWDALVSFVTIAAVSYTAYYCYTHGEKAPGYTAGFFAVLFYTGNMYGAYRSARAYNTAQNQYFRNSLQQKYIPAYNPVDFINRGKIFK